MLNFLNDNDNSNDKDESLHWIEHFNLRLAVISVCPVPVPSELLLSTHLPTSEGCTAELTADLRSVALTVELEPRREDPARFEVLRRSPSATPPLRRIPFDSFTYR